MKSGSETQWPIPIIDLARCTGCSLCVEACPTAALTLQGSFAVVSNPRACLYTGNCELVCPEDAITRPFQIIFTDQDEE